MARRPAALVSAALLALLVVAACGSSTPAPPPPSPTGVVARIEAPSELVLVDGRRIHVARMNGNDPLDACQDRADRALAERLVGGGRTVTVSQPRSKDSQTAVPAGFVQADVRTAGGDYADAFYTQQSSARNEACPIEPTTLPSVTEEPSSGRDIDVDVDRDDDGESRFCRGRWWC